MLQNNVSAQQTLYVQRFNLDGSAATSAIVVAAAQATGGNSLTDIGVGIDAGSNFVISWDVSDSTGLGTVYAQRLNGSGTPLWTPKTIISGTDLSPSLSVSGQGNFIIAWSEAGIFYQPYNSSGQATAPQTSIGYSGAVPPRTWPTTGI